eukprot:gene21939-28985_t
MADLQTAESGRIKEKFVETGLKFTSFLKTTGPGKLLMGLTATSPDRNSLERGTSGGDMALVQRLGAAADPRLPARHAPLQESGDAALPGYLLDTKTRASVGGIGSEELPNQGRRESGFASTSYSAGTAQPKHRAKKLNKILEAPVCGTSRKVIGSKPLFKELKNTEACPFGLLLNEARQATTLARKRREYQEMIPEFYEIEDEERSEEEVAALRQVIVDVPRTAPNVAFFQEAPIQKTLERLLYIWGIRHPASGYVQGMNDLVTPFLAIFLSEHLPGGSSMELWHELMLDVEADCYWCLCKLIEGIQDHYTYAQPGIQRTVFRIKELVRRVDETMADHLEEQSIDFIQFAWRWVNCLLIREVPFSLSFRLWDTYLAEGSRFSDFLVYVSASFLLTWTDQLRKMEFQDMIMFLQKPPSQDWDEGKMEMMLSRAFIWRTTYGDAQSHLKA